MAARRKPLAAAGAAGLAPQVSPALGLRRDLGVRHLVFLGVGAVVGAGVFSSIGDLAAGTATRPGAGPALALSFLLTAAACGLSALCYAELAAMLPVAGSAYSYARLALGELAAFVVGWDLIVEYAIGNVYVAQSFTDYLRAFLHGALAIDLPAWLVTDVQTAAGTPAIAAAAPRLLGQVVAFNLPAFLITAVLTGVLCAGARASARAGVALVVGKLALVLLFIFAGARRVDPANWTPFAPGGLRGIWGAASLAFFSYIGFDALTTAAEEVRDPGRALPRGMLWTLALCTLLYVATALVMTGLVPAARLGTGDPLAFALRAAGLDALANLLALGALAAVTSVLLVFQFGQPRILFAMARDGLLPAAFARVHPRWRTPVFGTVVTGVFVALLPSFMTPAQAIELTSIGTLLAFLLVSLAVPVLRRRVPGHPRPFRVPGGPVLPLVSAACCLVLMLGLPASNWLRFLVWLALGAGVYVGRVRARRRRSHTSP